jgi:hypothetical protein
MVWVYNVILKVSGISLINSGITGTSSYWGLPNVITDKSISCDRSVYIDT